MGIRILAIGKKHEPWVSEGIGRYQKRLSRPWDNEWLLLPHSSFSGEAAQADESKRLLDKIAADDFLVLLDERGHVLDSPAVATTLLAPLETSKCVVIIIGGAYGVDQSVTTRANFVWSLSKLVFPHQLVRLILIEQLYRAQAITSGHPYHHE